MTLPLIPVSRTVFVGKETEYAAEAVKSGWISSNGRYLRQFEETFARWVGCGHGVACTNGTAAVHLALLAAGVGPGDRVVVPSFTMMASVFPIVSVGAIPVFVDCDPETWCLDVNRLREIEGPVKAVMAVHIYGHPCDMDAIVAWAAERSAVVIEDAAEAHGATYRGRPVGSLGDLAAFSFYANKIITCGEGGIVTTDDPKLAERVQSFRNLCFDKDPRRRFIHGDVGYNFRMSNVHAAIALAQTEHADELVAMRRAVAGKYLERLRGLEDAVQLPVERPWAKNVYWVFGLLFREHLGIDAGEAAARLLELGVETRRFFYPGHQQPVFRDSSRFKDVVRASAPVTEALWQRGLYLPSPSDLTDAEVDRVVAALHSILGARGRA
jgi:perosamine synthetase